MKGEYFMKKVNFIKICFVLSGLFLFCFIGKTIFDYIQYSATLNSAPFSLWILENIVCFLLPSILIFIVAFLLKKKIKGKESMK